MKELSKKMSNKTRVGTLNALSCQSNSKWDKSYQSAYPIKKSKISSLRSKKSFQSDKIGSSQNEKYQKTRTSCLKAEGTNSGIMTLTAPSYTFEVIHRIPKQNSKEKLQNKEVQALRRVSIRGSYHRNATPEVRSHSGESN